MARMGKKRKWVIGLVVVLAVVVVAAAVIALTVPPAVEKRYQERKQAAYVALFYSETFGMECSSDPELLTGDLYSILDWDYFPMLFFEAEYVMEFPPENERRWAVVYIRPDSNPYSSYNITLGHIDDLNNSIASDSGIVVDPSLTLPLTKEQVVSNPDAVLDIIAQLDAEQWEHLYRGWYLPFSYEVAHAAGIEPPEE
jgi:hypothetical protein